MKKILIATDGSPSALQAVEFGLELAEEHQAEPIFVHVARRPTCSPSPASQWPARSRCRTELVTGHRSSLARQGVRDCRGATASRR